MINRNEQVAERFEKWKEERALLLKTIRKIYIYLIWVLLPIAIFFWLFIPVSRSMVIILFWSYYALWQFWMLSRSKTITWALFSRFFLVGTWVAGPIAALIMWSIHFVFADGASSINDVWSSSFIGPIVEEVVKLLPLLIFLFFTGKERQFSLADYALIGAALGTGFQFIEEVLRAWVSSRESLLASLFKTLLTSAEKVWGFDTLFPGYFQAGSIVAVGHHVWTAFVALGIGAAIIYRKRFGRIIWLLPSFLLLWAIFDHAMYNAQVSVLKPVLFVELAHFLSGQGHWYKWTFVLALLLAVYLDYKQLNRVKASLPLLPSEQLIEPFTELATLTQSFFKGPKQWGSMMGFFRERRAFGFALLLKEREGKRNKLQKRMTAIYQTVAVVVLLVLILGTFSQMAADSTYYFAGLFENLSTWWNKLNWYEKTGVIVTTALAIALFTVASGGGIIAAGFTGFGAAMVAKDVLDSSGAIANMIKNPKSAFGKWLEKAKQMPPQELTIAAAIVLLDALIKRFPATRALDELLNSLQKQAQHLGKKLKLDTHGPEPALAGTSHLPPHQTHTTFSEGSGSHTKNNGDSGKGDSGKGTGEIPKRTYEPSPKHDPKSGWGSPNPIPNTKIGQELLDNAYSSYKNKQLYNIYEGKLIKFQPDGDTGWHPYEVKNPAKEVPADVLRQLLKDGKITKVEYNKLLKNK
ncbi:PrsW family glutamic-type intramembrane protease [Cytobacillus dafuensis]|uniref:PrsW family intramembrane metalloprotease n=1 Tax=Cytobacillus dafuensis TaxID=1742359 RepID=A0A5B8Z082_CYTDA|nr:PrsW family glutamic-type intramembrane protease [Cytobacillus dafuensis]QED46424.1 PrsW family intramembrane metalloprotease [Cytobacillus dafuensis]